MSTSETELIERYFRDLGAVRDDVVLGIGDDAALLRAPPGYQLVQTTDALIAGVHFLPDSPARSLGHRALAINLSDIAAMGAAPAWALLSLAMPQADAAWLGEFAAGFGRLAREHGVALVGGNLSRGPLNINVQLTGLVPDGMALLRAGAQSGDEIWVSGTLGDAALGLALRQRAAAPQDPGSPEAANARPGAASPITADAAAYLCARFEYPTPRVALGQALRGLASACIDLSDGLLADLPRLAAASRCGVRLEAGHLPVSEALVAAAGASAWQRALLGGEDYELCFAAAPQHAARVQELATQLCVRVSRCGSLQSAAGLDLRREGAVIQFAQLPFDHFS